MTKAPAFPPETPAPSPPQNVTVARIARACACRRHALAAANVFLLRPIAKPVRARATARGRENLALPSAPGCRAVVRATFSRSRPAAEFLSSESSNASSKTGNGSTPSRCASFPAVITVTPLNPRAACIAASGLPARATFELHAHQTHLRRQLACHLRGRTVEPFHSGGSQAAKYRGRRPLLAA